MLIVSKNGSITTDHSLKGAFTLGSCYQVLRENVHSSMVTVNMNDDIGVAIVGMAVHLPGGIEDTDKYWSNLRDGICSIRKLERANR